MATRLETAIGVLMTATIAAGCASEPTQPAAPVQAPPSPQQAAAADPEGYRAIVDEIELVLIRYPIPLLQRLGGDLARRRPLGPRRRECDPLR